MTPAAAPPDAPPVSAKITTLAKLLTELDPAAFAAACREPWHSQSWLCASI